MAKIAHTLTKAERRERRVRAKIIGTLERPRLTVFRSNKHVYLQAINDEKGETLVASSEKEITGEKATKTEKAVAVAKVLAEKAKKAKIHAVVFDRGSYRYHGRVKVIAETLREMGIQV